MAKRSLREYRARREFQTTPEPRGGRAAAPSSRKPRRRFCVQKHLASHLHYDFRLEHQGVLLSWAVPKGPSLNPRDKRLAMRVEDHPLEYGEFEGVIPEGYGAGIVMLWDSGTWTPAEGFEDVDRAIEKGEVKFTLDGVKLKGGWVLVRRGRSGDERAWLLIKHRDEWAGELDIAEFAPLSVKSSGDFAEILAAENPAIWESHQPAKGGAAGAMLRRVIDEAARLKAAQPKGKRRKSAKRRASR